MILLLGTDAYSPFRMDAIKDALAKADPALGAIDVDAKWVYAIEEDGKAPSAADLERAANLLNAVGSCEPPAAGNVFFVTPRKGTISPWSSKATDIFRNCALGGIKRVERGIRFVTSKPLTPAAFAALYDKMTEGVYADISDLFAIDDPRPGRTFDVLAKGIDAIREANDEIGLAMNIVKSELLPHYQAKNLPIHMFCADTEEDVQFCIDHGASLITANDVVPLMTKLGRLK